MNPLRNSRRAARALVPRKGSGARKKARVISANVSVASLLLMGALLWLALAASVAVAAPAPRPRLVVVIVVDQLRADYLDRFNDLFLPPGKSGRDAGGFRFLRERGAQFPSARYKHFPLFTAPGHAVVSTGGYPYKTGIVGNEWFDKTTGQPMYSVSDESAHVVTDDAASKARPMSPRNLRSSTLGDELKMATGGRAKVVSLALKDRPAILLGGRLSDTTIWFDDSTGRWISSDFYCKSNRLPAWVEALNARRLPAARFGQTWTSSVPASAMQGRIWKPAGAPPIHPVHGLGAQFPHRVDGGEAAPGQTFYKAWTLSPWANEFVFGSAEQAVQSQELGRDEVPDLLAFNLSTNDYVGHAFGPDSAEVLDITVQTDRQLAQFFRFLDRAVPGGLGRVTIALTADHGVAPVPEDLQAAGFRAGRIEEADVVGAAQNALSARFGAQGAGIRAGTYREDVGPADIAPSLAAILGISRPSACDGTPLVSALR